ncbi:MAG: hypothetical protein C0502_08060 [Opitutus sp.]|nr:hypothetical protein [Opitutus sp.]
MRARYCFLAVVLLGPVAAPAQLLVWDVSGQNPSGSLTATTIASGLQSGSGFNALTRNGVVYASAASSFNSSNWTNSASLDMGSANSISFTLAPLSGYQLTLSSLQFAMWGSSTAPKNGVWAYRIDNGAYTTLGTTTLGSSASTLTSLNFGSDATLTSAQSITLAFFSYGAGTAGSIGGASAVGSGGTIRIGNITGNDLVVNGSLTAVPEPSTYAAIIGGITLAAAVWRRRRLGGA